MTETVLKHWEFMKPGPRRCDACNEGFVISTKRFGENVFTDKCSNPNCGKVFAEYRVNPR